MFRKRNSIDDVWKRIRFNPGSCWEWIGGITLAGYGMITLNGKDRAAHRVMYEIAYGPIPDGLVIDHLCRTRSCVNPLHMEAVTVGENTRRGTGKTMVASKRGTCELGHPFIRAKDGRQRCYQCYRKMRNAYRREWRSANIEQARAYHKEYQREWRARKKEAK